VSYSLSHEGEHLGELIFRRNQRLLEEELGQLESLLAALLYPMRNALLYRAATRSALRDPLTDTGNRIAMDQTLQREIDMARRHMQPLSLLMLDIDHFKTINDTHGHAAGDNVLRAVAEAIKGQLRNVDMVFRLWEEFLILLSNTGRDAAAMVGERLRHAAQTQDYRAEGTRIELTVSLGCSTLLPASQPKACCAGPTMRCMWPSAKVVTAWPWRAKHPATPFTSGFAGDAYLTLAHGWRRGFFFLQAHAAFQEQVHVVVALAHGLAQFSAGPCSGSSRPGCR
jgi:diguanylate cyclase (GGDEF)-like protein